MRNQAHPALEISQTFLHRLSPAFDLADVTDISTGLRDLTSSTALV